MQSISTIGLDIAKSVFQVHGVDDAGEVVIRRQLKLRAGVLSEVATVSGRHRGLRLITLLVTRTPSARSHRAPDTACVRKALRQAPEERCQGCRSDL